MTGLGNSKDRILLVDDEKEIRVIVSKLLSYMGYKVAAASNGKDGLRLFLDSPYHLVITDLDMPEVDGLTLAFSIKERSPRTPVVLITGKALEVSRGGPIDFVMRKPFTLVDLEQTVQMFLHR